MQNITKQDTLKFEILVWLRRKIDGTVVVIMSAAHIDDKYQRNKPIGEKWKK